MSRRNAFMVVVVLLLAAIPGIAVHLGTLVLPEDDAFIVYRYVHHLTSGAGLVYNEGERVFGVTSPLYVVWLAALKSAFPDVAIPILSVRWNLFFYLTAAAALWLALERMAAEAAPAGRPGLWASAGTAAFLLQPEMTRVSIGGMESFLFLTLLVASLAASFHRRTRLAFFLAGLATLARPEGMLVVVPLALAALRGTRPRDLALGLWSYALPVACWAIPATLYFGSPIPHSIIAKAAPLYPLEPGIALGSLFELFGFWAARVLAGEWGWTVSGLLISANLLAGVGAAFAGARSRSVLGLLLLFIIFYAVTNPLIFEWYWPHIYGMWFLCWLAGGLGWFSRSSTAGKRAVVGLLAIWWIGTTMWEGRVLSFISERAGNAADGAEPLSLGRSRDPVVRRIDTYREIAYWLNANTLGAVVAGPEIGALGFYYAGAILDTCGLVSPVAVAFHPVPMERRGSTEVSAIPRELVRSLLPDYVVTMPVFAFKSLLDWDWFARHYRLAKIFPLGLPPGRDLWGSREIAVYRRTDSVGISPPRPAATR